MVQPLGPLPTTQGRPGVASDLRAVLPGLLCAMGPHGQQDLSSRDTFETS